MPCYFKRENFSGVLDPLDPLSPDKIAYSLDPSQFFPESGELPGIIPPDFIPPPDIISPGAVPPVITPPQNGSRSGGGSGGGSGDQKISNSSTALLIIIGLGLLYLLTESKK